MEKYSRLNSSVSNLRNYRLLSETEIMDRISFLSKRVQDLEAMIGQKNKEISKLEAVNRYLVMGQQTRDEIIATALEESRKLKDSLEWYKYMYSLNNTQVDATLKRTITKHSRNDSRKRFTLQKLGTLKEPKVVVHDEKAKERLFTELLEDEDSFADRFAGLERQLQQDFLAHVRMRHSEYRSIVDLSLRLKRLVSASYKISYSLILNEAVDRLIMETCENLNCDRASLFLIDEVNGELWTKGAKGANQVIRLPLERGLVGYVALTGKGVNIENAYQDSRFDQSIDAQMNYKTRTILAIPVKDTAGKVIGVCQAINKEEGVFSSDDEAFLEMLTTHAGVIIRHSLQSESALLAQHRLQNLFNVTLKLFSANSVQEFEQIAAKGATLLVSSTQAVFYRMKQDRFLCISAEGKSEEKPLSGLAGHCAISGELLSVADAYSDPLFNRQTDMDTSMPIIVFPAKTPLGKIVAVIEMVNSRGVYGRMSMQKVKMDQLDTQILEYYGNAVATVLEKLFPSPD